MFLSWFEDFLSIIKRFGEVLLGEMGSDACVPLQGVTFPAMMAMWARWAPPLERSRLMTLSGSGASFGAFLALPLTGFICETLGWPAVFYLCGEQEKPAAHIGFS